MTALVVLINLSGAIVLDGSTTRADFTGNEIPFANVGDPWTFTVLDADTVSQANAMPSFTGRVRVGSHDTTHIWDNMLGSFEFHASQFHGHVELDIGPEWWLLLEPESGPSGFDVGGTVDRITENVTLPETSSFIVWMLIVLLTLPIRRPQ